MVLLILIFYPFQSCMIITDKDEYVECSVNENCFYGYFDFVMFRFSSECNEKEIESMISIKEENQPISVSFYWNGYCLFVKPESEWKKGMLYTINFGGYPKVGNQTIDVVIQREFIYGLQDEMFSMMNSKLPEDLSSPLEMQYNKSINKTSLISNISVTPSIEYEVQFINGDSSVLILPIKKWEVNTEYKVSFKNIVSKDSYHAKDQEVKFVPLVDVERPSLVGVCPVEMIEGEYVYLDNADINGIIGRKDMIGFVFSKAIDPDSLCDNLKFYPDIKGKIVNTDDSFKKFTFIPDEYFIPDREYQAVFNEKIHDKNGIELSQKYQIYFITRKSYVSIKKISVNCKNIPLKNNNCKIQCYPHEYYHDQVSQDGKYSINISILFDSDFEREEYSKVCEEIKFRLLFPLTARSPILNGIHWPSPDNVILDFENLSISNENIPVYYELKINGGKYGITNKYYEIMEDDWCFYIEPIEAQ